MGRSASAKQDITLQVDNPLGPPSRASVRDDGDSSPTTPETPETPRPNVLLDADPELGTSRKHLHFLLFVLLSLAMLVYAVVVAVMMLYILLVAAESIVFVLALQSTFLVAALVWGIHAACVASEPALNAFSFMLLMAVVMQFSLAMVVVVRGDEMQLFFESSALAARIQLCADLGIAVVANATVDSVNANFTSARTSEFMTAGMELCGCDDEAAQCVMAYVRNEYGFIPEQYNVMQLVVILVQLMLAKLAWGMIADLDYVLEQKQKKQPGGPPTAVLQGTIISATNLLDTSSKRGRDPMCLLELLTPDTGVKHHKVQRAETPVRTDTLTPQWDHDVDQMIVYGCSKQLRISVLDMSKRKKPVTMGSASLMLDGQYIQRATGLPEPMDGNDLIQVKLSLTETVKKSFKRGTTEQTLPAGMLSLKLLYIPVGGSAERIAKSVTSSWYFEATVLMMVGLSMVILALQSPTDPPSDAMRGTLSLLEIFVATHMTIELALELFAHFANGVLKREVRNPWMALALFVCLCNWIAIFQPVEIVQRIPGGQGWAKVFSVSRIFRVVRPIRTLRMIRHVEIVTRVIASQMSTLLTVCGLLLFLLLLFSLIGMSSFSGAIHYTCMDVTLVRGASSESVDRVVHEDWPQGCSDDCESYVPQTLITRGILRGVQPLQSEGMLVSCPQSLRCAQEAQGFLATDTSIVRCMHLGTGECFPVGFNNYNASSREMAACESLSTIPAVGNDEFGFQGFDNIIRATVTMFVQMTGDGGMHAMPHALHAAGSGSEAAAWIIFFIASLCLNLVALNLFLAVCCGAYSGVSSELSELDAMLAKKQRARDKLLQLDETAEEKEQREAVEAERALSVEDRVEALDWSDTTSRVPGCRNVCKRIVLSQTFDHLISIAILGNTLVMALNHRGISQESARVLAVIETTFLVLFLLEAVLKISGLGKTLYFMHLSNKFDFWVMGVCISGYMAMMFEDELVDTFGLENAEAGAGMQALRAVRLLRALQLTRLLHKHRGFRAVLKTIFSAWRPICVHAIFCCFSVCMFAVIGMHVMGGSLGCRVGIEDSPGGVCPEEERVALHQCPDCRKALRHDYPYENFETFPKGVLATFELTVGEEWSHVMYWYMAHAGEEYSLYQAFVQIFFVAQYLWMNCILFSLFTAMLLENFNLKEDAKMPIQKQLWERRKRKELKIWRAGKDSLLMKTLDTEKQKGVTKHEETMRERLLHAAAVADLHDNSNKSLFMFTLDSPFRLRCAAIQDHRVFRNGILGLIVLSCVSLAIEGPKQGYVMQQFGIFFESINAIVLVAFVFEASLKVIVHGFCLTSGPTKPYMRTNKNLMDFFVIVICLIAYLPIVGEVLQGGWAKALRLIRVMTPLISLTKNPDILLVVISFLRALPDTLVVVLPLFLMALVFGVIGQQWFGGMMGQCLSDTAGLDTLELCIEAGATWNSPMFNFDNAVNAVSLLFVAITDGVHGYMVDYAETVAGGSPIVFWIAFHIVFTCFFLNLFIGVLSASFSKSKGTATRTTRQTQWVAVAHSIESFNPVVTIAEGSRPYAGATCCRRPQPDWWFKCRLLCYKAAINPAIENVWRAAIAVNTLTLATDKFPANTAKHEVVYYVNIVCLSMLTLEVVLKLTGYGFRTFFGSGWLISDFLLVSLSWGLRLGSVRSGVETLRVVRIFRLVALASKLPTLVALIGSLVACVRQSLALVAICCVIIYFYCILGMNFFGSLEVDSQMPSYNDYNNFSNFLSSAALLIQIAFGQGIGGLIEDLTGMGVSFLLAFGYFASFYMVMLWVCVNLLLVTILETFDAETADTDTGGARQEDFQLFTHTWASLTIGAHAVPYCNKKESLLSKMAHKVAHPVDTVRHAIAAHDEENDDEIVPEDGDPRLQGNLTITIQHVHGIPSDVIRPYCRVQLRGLDKQEVLTPPAETVDGTAAFHDWLDADAKGCTVSMEINEHHDRLVLKVHDHYQYMGDTIGAVKILKEEIEAMEQPTTKVFRLQRRADVEPLSRDGAAARQDHWARFETDSCYVHETVDEFEQLEEVDEFNEPLPQTSLKLQSAVLGAHAFKAVQVTNDDASSEAMDARRNSFELEVPQAMSKAEQKAYRRAEKERKKAEKRRMQAEKKAKQKELKRAKKEAKRRKKAGLPEAEEEEVKEDQSPTNPSDDVVVHEWIDSGVSLQVTFEFKRYDLRTPRMGFLEDFEVTYSNKESNCGVEGWLECSEDGGPFKRRFVYLQDKGSSAKAGHGGAIKMITNVDNGNSLEHLASKGKLEILKLPTESIMNIYSEHVHRLGDDTHRKQAKNVSHVGCEFQIGVDLQNENTFAEKKVAHISGSIISAENLTNVATGKGETSDPYCVLTLFSTGMLAAAAGKSRQVQKTDTVTDDLNPSWNREFVMDASVTTTTMRVEVFHDRLGRDPLIGTAEFQLASVSDERNGPGSVWSSSAIVSHGGATTVDFGGTGRTQVKVRLTPPTEKRRFKEKAVAQDADSAGAGNSGGTLASDANGAGIVTLDILYAPLCSQHDVQYLMKMAQDIDQRYTTPLGKDKKADAAKLAELRASQLAVIAPKRVDYRFRALSPGNQMCWVTAIRWLTLGCPDTRRPKPIPHASLVRAELVRASNNIALLDLPVSRLTRLIRGLYKRQAVGGHLPTRRWVAYAIFNIELHAMANTKAGLKNKETRRGNAHGVYLADVRGLSFHRTLNRLVLLHLGKRKCLSYHEHAAEYELETNSVSLHIIKAALQWWVNRKRWGKPQGGKKFPKLPIWSTNEALYLQASEAVCVARLRSLRVLFAEVMKRKPVGYELPGQQTQNTHKAGKRVKTKTFEPEGAAAEGEVQVDVARIETVFKDLDSSGSGELNEQNIRAGVQVLMGPSIPVELESRMVEMIDTDQAGVVDLPQFIRGFTLIAQEARGQEDGLMDEGSGEGDSDLEDLDTDIKELQRKYGRDED